MTNEMVTTVMDFAETVKVVEEMKKNAEANVAFANQLKANIVTLQESTAHGLVVHNGKVLVQVERKAREGDYVVFEGLNSYYTVNGDFYETYEKNGTICYTATDNDCYTVYDWGDFCETTKVYEVIGNLPQSNLVVEAFEPTPIENGTKPPCKHLTANQKRARAIKMAKEFVEDSLETFSWVNKIISSETTIDSEKRKVKFELSLVNGKRKGKAKCKKGEVFNEHIGEAIALAKALDIVEELPPDILKAVQPDVCVKGMKIVYIHQGLVVEREVEREVEQLKDTRVYFTNESWMPNDEVSIIDDTNAQYETTKGGE